MSEHTHSSGYLLTDKGRLALAQLDLADTTCHHVYEMVRRGWLACIKCPYEIKLTRSNVRAGGWNGKD